MECHARWNDGGAFVQALALGAGRARRPDARPLAELPPDVRVCVGASPTAFQQAPPADAILACDGGAPLLQRALGRTRSHPVPALVESPLVLTNSRGVFSSSLAEFALAGLLHFAKDVPRLERQRLARRWEPFAMQELRGRTLGIVGYGDIGRAVARLARKLPALPGGTRAAERGGQAPGLLSHGLLPARRSL